MKYRPRIYYSDTQKALMWDRWQKGDSMHAIARLFDRGHGSIQRILSETGGIRSEADTKKPIRHHTTVAIKFWVRVKPPRLYTFSIPCCFNFSTAI